MNVRTAYLHVLDGRVRVKVAEVKGSAAAARVVEQRLGGIEGVDHVSANPTTGNVLVLFNQGLIDQKGVLAALQGLGYLTGAVPATGKGVVAGDSGVVGMVAETFAKTAMEFALQRLVTALI